jgi:hypothetical protein
MPDARDKIVNARVIATATRQGRRPAGREFGCGCE